MEIGDDYSLVLLFPENKYTIVYLFHFCPVNYFKAETVLKLSIFSYMRLYVFILKHRRESIDNENREAYS